MQIHLARNGQLLGLQEAEAIPALVQNGTILPSDLFWHDGMAEWAAVQSKWPAAPADAPPVVPPVIHPAAPISLDRAAIAQANPAIIRGARWFWWIAGLSLVNTVMIHSGSNVNFVIGLGFTLITDSALQNLKLIAFAIDAVAIGFFFGAGWFAGRGHFWAFVLGLFAYVGDALIYVIAQSWMSVAFHALAIFYMIRGARELRAAVREARNPAG